MLKLIPDCFSCTENFNPSQSSLGSEGKKFVEVPQALLASDVSSLITGLSLINLLPKAFSSDYISFAKSNIIFLSDNLARAML